MQNLEYQFFLKEYGNILNEQNRFMRIMVNNQKIIIGNNESRMEIDCTNEDSTYSGKMEIVFDNNKEMVDYTKTFMELGFPNFLVGLVKYFNLKARVEICDNNIYILIIGGPELDGMNLLFDSSLDNYFKDIDVYMTDINLRRSNIISNVEKFAWYVSSLNYMQTVGRNKTGKIKLYNVNISSLVLDTRLMSRLRDEVSDNIFMVDTITFTDCVWESQDIQNQIQTLFRGAKIIIK